MVQQQAGTYQLGRLKGEYCVVWREEGKRRRFRLGVRQNRPEVEAWAALNEFVRQREAAQLKEAGLTIGAIWQAYVADRKAEGKNVRNIEYMWRSLEPTFAAITVDDLGTPMIVDGARRTICHKYAIAREAQGKSRDTIWTELGYIRTAVNWAWKRSLVPTKPYVWLPVKGGPREVVITEAEAQSLMDATPTPHVRLFVILALATSARMGGVLDLTWDRVDFERRVIDFRKAVDPGILSKRGRKNRAVVPFGDLVATALGEAREAARTDYVVEWAGQPIQNIRKGFAGAVRRAGLEDRGVTVHALRHSGATWWADASVDMRKIQKMLGHSSMKVTEAIYAKYSPSYLREAADVIDLRMRR